MDTSVELTAELIHGFAGAILAKRYDKATPTPLCHLEWWRMCCSSKSLVAIAAPRNHAKSTAITHAYTLANVLFRKRKFVILVSDTETQAVDFLREIKEELKSNEDLISLFEIESFIKDSESDIIVQFKDKTKFRIMARGAEQRVRGLKWDQFRPDLIICDDLENEELVYNKDRREKFRKWFFGALLPARSRDGIVRVVGTILHMDSLLNRLMPEESENSTVVEPLKTYNFSQKRSWSSARYRAYTENFEQLLWPSRFSKEFFIQDRDDRVNQGIAEIHSQEYLNYPIDEATSYFRRSDFFDMEEWDRKSHKRYYAACDFAISREARSDYTVIAIAGVDETGKLSVEDIRRGRWDALEIIEEMFSVQQAYQPDLFITEKGAIQKSLGPSLNAEMMKRSIFLNLYPMTPTRDKVSRARAFQARLRSGGVKFDKKAGWYMELEDEMVRFPRSRHDDQVDALAWIGLVLDQLQDAASAEELEEEEYNEMYGQNAQTGRSVVTGY